MYVDDVKVQVRTDALADAAAVACQDNNSADTLNYATAIAVVTKLNAANNMCQGITATAGVDYDKLIKDRLVSVIVTSEDKVLKGDSYTIKSNAEVKVLSKGLLSSDDIPDDYLYDTNPTLTNKEGSRSAMAYLNCYLQFNVQEYARYSYNNNQHNYNTYLYDIANSMNCYLPFRFNVKTGKNASEHSRSVIINEYGDLTSGLGYYKWMENFGEANGWKECDTAQEAKERANAGYLTFAINRGGETIIILPDLTTTSDNEISYTKASKDNVAYDTMTVPKGGYVYYTHD